MEEVQCPEIAYNKIINSEIYDIIKRENEKIKDILLMHDFSSSENIFDEARTGYLEDNGKISERYNLYKNIMQFDNDLENDELFYLQSDHIRKLIAENPSFFAYAVLGENLLNYFEFGFPTMKSLEESVASFCIGERVYGIRDSRWIWRNKGMKNVIFQTVHGDLWAGQIDLSDRIVRVKDLFGEYEKFDTLRRIEHPFGVQGYQDWSQFLYSILLYAKEIGKDKIPEIVNWREVLAEVGAVGTNTAECEFGGSHFGIDYLLDRRILNDKEKPDSFPLHVPSQSGERFYLPFVKDGRLLYFLTDNCGEDNFDNLFLEKKKFKKLVEYDEFDLPDLLKANYRLFSRDRSILPIIMNHFNGR